MIVKTYQYKQQGNGSDSWVCTEKENGVTINKYMVYEDPNKKPVMNLDLVTMFQNLTQGEKNQIKTALGL